MIHPPLCTAAGNRPAFAGLISAQLRRGLAVAAFGRRSGQPATGSRYCDKTPTRTATPLLCVALPMVLVAAAHAQTRETAEQQPPIQARPGGPEGAPKTDQTIDVAKGTRLVLTNNAGEVVVRSWERDQVRIQASHTGREQVEAQTTDMTLRVRARSQRGPSGLVDYQVTVPRWMPVNVSGT